MNVADLVAALAPIAERDPAMPVRALFWGVENDQYGAMQFDVQGVVENRGLLYIASEDMVIPHTSDAMGAWQMQERGRT